MTKCKCRCFGCEAAEAATEGGESFGLGFGPAASLWNRSNGLIVQIR